MSRTVCVRKLTFLVNHFNLQRAQCLCPYTAMAQSHKQSKQLAIELPERKSMDNSISNSNFKSGESASVPEIGENVSRREKISILVRTLKELGDNKQAIYGTLDAWVAWERDFPIGRLKNVLLAFEKEQQWHKMIQIIKWMLSKGQGATRGTYGQLIQALDMDDRFDEAHDIWKKKLGFDLHSVPWKLCKQMISIYYRNSKFEDLVKLFKGLEAFDRKPPERSIVNKVATAYELLGMLEEKERILEKYKDLFTESSKGKSKKFYRPPKRS